MSSVAASGVTVVTGGGGFIGSHLLRRMDRDGLEVRTLLGPRGSAAVDPPGSVRAVEGDVNEPGLLDHLLEGASAVVHLAGPASVAGSFRDPGEYRRVHVEGTANLCDAAAHAGVARVVLVSSAEVYGRAERIPVAEAAIPAPRSPYGAAKVAAEAVLGAQVRAGCIDSAVVVRPFSVYGDGMAKWSLFGSLMASAARGEALAVRDPRPVRDYVHVDDVVEALVRLTAVATDRDVVTLNLCTGAGRSVAQVRDVVAGAFGVPVEQGLRSADRPGSADILELVGDPGALATLLGWAPATSLEAGVESMAVARSGRRIGRGTS